MYPEADVPVLQLSLPPSDATRQLALGARLHALREEGVMPYAHPSVEHLVPLCVTLGAAADPEAARDFTIDGFWMGLSKRSLQVI